jgi:hypothetical protein
MEEKKRKLLDDLAEHLLKGRQEASIDICKVLASARMSEKDLSDLIYHYHSPELRRRSKINVSFMGELNSSIHRETVPL